MPEFAPDELLTVAAARVLTDGTTTFVGIGPPGAAANLAQRLHAPNLVLVYESGAIGAKPDRLPLSIGDGILGETADAVVGVPEMFNYWVQPGRIDVGFLGAAQIDRYGNINTTVVGDDYAHPKVRLPGAGGAPEIAANCGEVIVILRQSARAFVERVDFVTSVGHGDGSPGYREQARPARPRPHEDHHRPRRPGGRDGSNEFVMVALHEGVTREQATEATGWELRFADDVETLPLPTAEELETLRALKA